jgi:hypothetical protein
MAKSRLLSCEVIGIGIGHVKLGWRTYSEAPQDDQETQHDGAPVLEPVTVFRRSVGDEFGKC